MKKLASFLFITMMVFDLRWQNVKADDGNFYQNAAEFVYKFPATIKNKTGKLCLFGYDQVVFLLKSAHRGDIVIFKNGPDILKSFESSKCKVLYIAKNTYDDSLAIEIANKHKIASISLDEGFIDKSGLILMQAGRRSFDLIVNKDNIKLYDIKFDYMASSLIVN